MENIPICNLETTIAMVVIVRWWESTLQDLVSRVLQSSAHCTAHTRKHTGTANIPFLPAMKEYINFPLKILSYAFHPDRHNQIAPCACIE